MFQIRILNGNNEQLKSVLGDLADKVRIQKGDAVLEMETEEEVTCGRAVFEKLLTQGYAGFAVDPITKDSQLVKDYDPARFPFVVMSRPLAGG